MDDPKEMLAKKKPKSILKKVSPNAYHETVKDETWLNELDLLTSFHVKNMGQIATLRPRLKKRISLNNE